MLEGKAVRWGDGGKEEEIEAAIRAAARLAHRAGRSTIEPADLLRGVAALRPSLAGEWATVAGVWPESLGPAEDLAAALVEQPTPGGPGVVRVPAAVAWARARARDGASPDRLRAFAAAYLTAGGAGVNPAGEAGVWWAAAALFGQPLGRRLCFLRWLARQGRLPS